MACVDGRGQCARLKIAGNGPDSPPPSPLILLCFALLAHCLLCTLPYCIGQRYVLFNICCDYGRVFRRIYRCSLLTVTYFFVAWFDYLLYVMLRLAIVFLSITLYICSGEGHSAKQKAHAVSSLRVNLLVIVMIIPFV